MQQELNEKIKATIENEGSWGENEYKKLNTFEDKNNFCEINSRIASNAIEKLILQEKIDLLKGLQEDFMNKFLTKSASYLGYKITELNNQLNQL